jgi:hypothetical protein
VGLNPEGHAVVVANDNASEPTNVALAHPAGIPPAFSKLSVINTSCADTLNAKSSAMVVISHLRQLFLSVVFCIIKGLSE